MPEASKKLNNSAPKLNTSKGGIRFFYHFAPVELIIFSFALLLRILYIWQISDSPFFTTPILDAEIYDQKAWQIAKGDGIGDEAFFQAPLFTYFLALIYKIFGHNDIAPRLIHALLGALSAMLVVRLGRRIYDSKIAFLAGLIFSGYGPLIFYSGQLLIPTLYIFLILLFLCALNKLTDSISTRKVFLTGFLLGLAALARPNILIFLPFALLWILVILREFTPSFKIRARNAVLFLLGTILAIAPVTVRNYLVANDFVLISSQAGVNFYMGNNPYANGYSGWVPGTSKNWWGKGYSQTIELAERDAGKPLKASEVSAYWWKRTWNDISAYPSSWIGLFMKKIHFLLAGYELSDTEDIYYQRRDSWLLSALLWDRVIAFPFGLLLPLALLGLALSDGWKRQSHLILFQISYAISIVLFLVTSRYRLPLIPVFCLWAAAGITLPFRFLKSGWIKKYALTLCGFILLLIFINRNPFAAQRIRDLDGAFNLGTIYLRNGENEKALEAFRQAANLDSTSGRPHHGIGAALLKLGRVDEAKAEFERSVLLTPNLEQAHNNLARILHQQGELDKAEFHFGQVLILDSTNAFAHRGLADIALERKDYLLAETHYAKAHQLGDADKQLMSRWAQALLQQGKFPDALKVNTELLTREPNDARVHHNQARLYIACDSLDQAQSELEIVLRLDPGNSTAEEQLKQVKILLERK